jgi:hypothetical protein
MLIGFLLLEQAAQPIDDLDNLLLAALFHPVDAPLVTSFLSC